MSFSEENIKRLVEKVYQDALQNCVRDTKNTAANHVHIVLEEKYGTRLSVRTIVRTFDKYIQGKHKISTPEIVTINILCMYLGYENYQDYISTNSPRISINDDQPSQKKKRSKKTVYVIFGILFFTSGITIVWNNYDIIFTQNLTGIDVTKSKTSEITKEKDSVASNKPTEKQEEKIVKKSMKLGIFHNGSVDLNITKRLQQHLFKNYKVAFIQLPNMNAVTLQKLQQGNIDMIKNKSSHYYCIGTVSYRFRQAETNTELIICELQLQYTTYDTDGNFISQFSNTRNIRAHGFTKTEAQANAILKL